MAKMVIGEGLDNYSKKLNDLKLNTKETLGRAIYAGAKIVADQVKENIESIPVSNSSKRGTATDPIDTITSAQKAGLREGFGISDMRADGDYLNVKLGFDGYNSQVSDVSKKNKWSSSKQANAMIARAVEGGTSFRRKHPFVAPAVRATKTKAEEKMAEVLDEEIAKKMR